MSSSSQVEEIKGKIDIVELVQEYLPLKRAGRNFKGLCPFHGEKTPSFMVNPELQIFKCFGCSEGGDVYEFYQKMEGVEFGEALRVFAKRVGVALTGYQMSQGEEVKEVLLAINHLAGEYYHYLLTKHELGKEAMKYLKGRGISEEVIEIFKLGYAPDGWDFVMKFLVGKKNYKIEDLERAGLTIKSQNTNSNIQNYYDRFRNRVMFPLNNHRGQTVGFAGRVMPGADEKSGGKYVNTPETEVYHKGELLYGLDINKTEIKKMGWVVVVEGEIDSISSYLADVKNVVAIKGSALTEKQVELLRRYVDTLVLGLDADVAGDAAVRRGIEVAQKAGLLIKIINSKSETLNPKHFKDPGEWGIADPVGWKKAVFEAIPIYDFYIESAVERHGLDAIGKQRVGRELVPIWAKMDDEIVRAHYIKKLAGVLGVGEEDIRAQLGKVPSTKFQDTSKESIIGPTSPKASLGAREVRERRVVQLALLGNKPDELIVEPIAGWIKGEFWKRVAHELSVVSGQLSVTEKVNKLPAELRDGVSSLFLGEEEFDEKNWTEAKNLLELAQIEETLKTQDNTKEVDILAKRKAELTKAR